MGKDGAFSFLTTKLEDIIRWGQKNSLYPLPYGTSCCGIEMMSTLASDYDLARFGAEVVRFSPRQSDLLIVAGIINCKMSPVLRGVWEQMSDPKYVLCMGACASSGGSSTFIALLRGSIRSSLWTFMFLVVRRHRKG